MSSDRWHCIISANATSRDGGETIDYVTRTKSIIRETPAGYRLPGRLVEFSHLAAVFKGKQNKADIIVTYGYPVWSSQLTGAKDNELVMLGLDAGAFLVNSSGEETVSNRNRIDQVYLGEIQQFEDATLWPGIHRLQAAPGTYTLSVEFDRTSDGSIGVNQEKLTVPDFHVDTFMMSDILLAYYVEDAVERDYAEGVITRKGLDIQAAPWGIYENDAPVYFYFELYNLKASPVAAAEYTVEAILIDEKGARRGRNRLFKRFRRNQDTGVAVSFDGISTTPDAEQYLILDTEELEEGNYVLTVRVTDSVSNSQVERERTIYVR